MTEWILSSSVLILAVLGLRLVFRDRIGHRLRYALWGLVLLRLLIPGSLLHSAASVSNLAAEFTAPPVFTAPTLEREEALAQVLEQEQITRNDYEKLPQPSQERYDTQAEALVEASRREAQLQIQAKESRYQLAKTVLLVLWLSGAGLMALVLLVFNLRFAAMLKRSRKPLEHPGCFLPVYVSGAVESPCLFGLFRPAVYLPEDCAEGTLPYILAHEQTHLRHCDHIWALLRSVCLALHWYNPLVWLSVKLSHRDSELACDEGTLERLGEENREQYGKVLIEMSRGQGTAKQLLLTATTMSGDKQTLYARIKAIARKPKVWIPAIVLSLLIAAIAVGCTFTGAETPETPTEPQEETTLPPETTIPPETTSPEEKPPSPPPIFIYPTETEPPAAEPQAPNDLIPITDEVLVKLMDMLYVLDETAGTVQALPDGYYYIGIGYELSDRFPKWNFEANNIPADTEFYASMENPDYVYYLAEDGYRRMLRAALSEEHKAMSGAAAPVPEDTTLAFFNTLLGNPDTPYHQSMDNVFYSPYAVDLYDLFYKGFNEWEQRTVPLTEEEKTFLYANGWDDGYAKPISNAKRFPISAMDAQLKRFFGISYAESYKTGIDRHSHFLESTQCFYTWRSDTRAFRFTIQSLQETAPGTFQITYLCEGYPSTLYRMTLKAGDGVFLIQSNVPA